MFSDMFATCALYCSYCATTCARNIDMLLINNAFDSSVHCGSSSPGYFSRDI